MLIVGVPRGSVVALTDSEDGDQNVHRIKQTFSLIIEMSC